MEELRGKLVGLARSAGARPDEAEDIANEALLAAHKKKPERPDAYAKATVRKLVAKLRRPRQHGPEDVFDPNAVVEPVSAAHADVERMLDIDGAVENIVVWGGEGSTSRCVNSITDVDTDEIKKKLAFYLAVIDGLPQGDRQRRRLREKFTADIRGALESSGYKYSVLPRQLAENWRTGNHPPEPASMLPFKYVNKRMRVGKKPSKKGMSTMTFVVHPHHPAISRGMLFAQHFAPSLEREHAIHIAQEAYKHVFGHPAS